MRSHARVQAEASHYFGRLVPMPLWIYGSPSHQSQPEVPERLNKMKILYLYLLSFSALSGFHRHRLDMRLKAFCNILTVYVPANTAPHKPGCRKASFAPRPSPKAAIGCMNPTFAPESPNLTPQILQRSKQAIRIGDDTGTNWNQETPQSELYGALEWCREESNCRHMDFQSIALPSELRHRFRLGLQR